MRVELSGRGLHRVELWKSPIERYEARTGTDGALAARKLAFAPETRLKRVSGTVTKSLSVADLRASHFDLLTHPRPGDYFDILG